MWRLLPCRYQVENIADWISAASAYLNTLQVVEPDVPLLHCQKAICYILMAVHYGELANCEQLRKETFSVRLLDILERDSAR